MIMVRALQFQTVGGEGAGGLLCVSRLSTRDQSRAPEYRAGVACNKPAITRSADSLACGLAGRDKSPPGYCKQFARHGQAFYRPSGTLLSMLLCKADRIMVGQNHAERKTRGAVLYDSVASGCGF